MKYTTEIFKEKAAEVHKNDKVPPTYDKVEYINNCTKVCITCPIHGDYWQSPRVHLRGCGCPKCSNNNFKKTPEDFIKEAKDVHKNDEILPIYDKVEYVDAHTKVCIICPIHGEFWQTPHSHLQGHGCPHCANNAKMSTEDFIKEAKEVHKNDAVQMIYDESVYINSKTKLKIICPIHGEFWQTPNKHLYRKQSCPKCNGGVISNTNEFIEKAKKIHGDTVIYDEVNYINSQKEVKLICPIHGEFWQKPLYHLQGNGCPLCNRSKLEKHTDTFLAENNILFETQKRFSWLKKNKKFSLDFYIQQINIGIECQGEQHYKEVKHFGGKNALEYTVANDKLKNKLCKNHNISLYYIFDDNVNLLEIYNDIYNKNNCFRISEIEKLLNIINSEKNEILA